MDVPLEITFRNIDHTQELEDLVRKKAAKLERFYHHIISCQVAVERPHQHESAGNPIRVRIRLAVPPDHEVIVTKEPLDNPLHMRPKTVVIDAFKAAERQLKELKDRQRGEVKTHDVPSGLVVRLFKEEGYGFIRTDDDREIYFHRNSVLGRSFDQIEIGTEVRFEAEMGEEGPQASTVRVLSKPGARAKHTEEDDLPVPPGWKS